MSDRLTVDTITSDQLDALYDELEDTAEQHARNIGTVARERESYRAAWKEEQGRRVQAEAERDGAYRERAQLIALLAAMTPKAVITPAEDVEEPGWHIVYLLVGGRQASWHIAPRDAELFEYVKHVDSLDPLTIWDGHTTEQKYDRIRDHIAHRWFVPPAKYVRSDGVQTCPHTVPVGPDSCWECRDLAHPVRPVVGG